MSKDLTDDLDTIVARKVADALAAREPKPMPSPHLPVTKPWPKIGPHLAAALERATDDFEAGRNVVDAVERHVYQQEWRDAALGADLRAWRFDDKGNRHDWAHKLFESGLIQNLVENRHSVREAKRGTIVSALPDWALPLITGEASGK